MFAGIDEVDWASMEHAYGPADDVPGLLRGLASADPAERERALDGMYGAVHHQGDVYPCTLACIPFLFELVTDPAVVDRGDLVELLTSIGGIDLGEDDEEELDEEEAEGAANYAMAAAAVTANAGVFLTLLADEDPGVRLSAPLALAALHDDPAGVLTLLRARLAAEPDEEVRFALVEAAGRLALRHGTLAAPVADWLSRLAAEANPPGLRLAALAQLARCAPRSLPDDVVTVVTGLLRKLRTSPGPGGPRTRTAEAPGAGAEAAPVTLLGQVRALSAEENAGRAAPWTADLLRTLHAGLDDRVAERAALLAEQLRSPDPWQRVDAVRLSEGLIGGWRGSYAELVRVVGEQLAAPEPRLAEAASHLLEGLFGLAAPAADALAERVAADPGAWVRTWPDGRTQLGSAVKALARLGDPRALPALTAALGRPLVPYDVGPGLARLGEAARPLTGALRRRLGEEVLDERAYDRVGPLLVALTALRAGEAAPEVLRVLRGAPEPRGEWVRTVALRALASFGPAARCAVPELRAMVLRGGTAEAAEAAGALWAVEGDAGAVLPALVEGLAAADVDARRAAAEAVGRLGGRAAVAAPRLRALLRHESLWLRVDAAIALWEVSGRAEESVPVLLAAWAQNPHVRVRVAECLARMRPAGAGSDAARVLLTELTSVRRHNAPDGDRGSHHTYTDEKLLALCRRALLGNTGKEPT
ncbi:MULTISPECIES: PBS lyase [unclassified Streptomyces]|uniref:PBS lyase n=1 Tax=unclassified Streptomyces TaxID=2593676 RepID=UPI002ED625F7|nr:PBS lyase [Streptomyces sp. NBC_00891]WSY07792.1 PBS lyase [Streptomyces sp. NBC_00890]WSZ09418.1 PBS lyase [Streptomyces sp. NBC_00869]WSZ23083.1 PBS lyase [Streptomyces sp. NBC_00870]